MTTIDKKFITFKVAIAVIRLRDTDIDSKLQSAYLDYIQAAYVDNALEQSGTDIDNIWRSYVS